MAHTNRPEVSFGMQLSRFLFALIAALLLIGLPLPGDESGGGEGGIVILPGGRNQNNISNQGGPRLQLRRELTAQDLVMRLPDDMEHAVGMLSVDGAGAELLCIDEGLCVVPAGALEQMHGLNAKILQIQFVAPNLSTLTVELLFDGDGDGYTLRVM